MYSLLILISLLLEGDYLTSLGNLVKEMHLWVFCACVKYYLRRNREELIYIITMYILQLAKYLLEFCCLFHNINYFSMSCSIYCQYWRVCTDSG